MNDLILEGFKEELLKLAKEDKYKDWPVTRHWEKAREAERLQGAYRLISPSGKVSPAKAKRLNRAARESVAHMVKAEQKRQVRRRKKVDLGRLATSFKETGRDYGKTFKWFGKNLAATLSGEGTPKRMAQPKVKKPLKHVAQLKTKKSPKL